jgi:hypothetical protein
MTLTDVNTLRTQITRDVMISPAHALEARLNFPHRSLGAESQSSVATATKKVLSARRRRRWRRREEQQQQQQHRLTVDCLVLV